MMFWRRRREPEVSKSPEPETVDCYRCGVILLKSRATKVMAGAGWHKSPVWFCDAHKPAYDEWEVVYINGADHSLAYYRRMEVSKDGTPIGYVKAPEAPGPKS